MHPLSTYLVFQALTAMVSLAYTGVLSVDGIGWATGQVPGGGVALGPSV